MEKSRAIAFVVALVLLIVLLVVKPFEKETVIPEEEFEEVFIAASNINGKNIVKAEDIETRKIHKTLLPQGSIRDMGEIIGRVSRSDIYAGDIFTEEKISDIGDTSLGLAVIVPDGMRAITLEVEIDTGVAGLLKVGNKVDVISVLSLSEDEDMARVTLQNREILALDKKINNAAEDVETSYIAVTLSVDPEEASRLTLAESMAKKTRLVLRNQEDTKNTNVRNIIKADIIN